MRTPRQHQVDRALARAMARASDYLFGFEVLYISAEFELPPPALTRSELAESLAWHDSQRHLVSLQADTGPRYRLSELGRAWRSENP